ncbi:hypothetical protein ABZY03_31135 [Streptomyces klenkii]|uniref:hypothetical protein n=1 Tax=Streptomyces klenkii TaxID=1420899 RepID=UPI0033A03D70
MRATVAGTTDNAAHPAAARLLATARGRTALYQNLDAARSCKFLLSGAPLPEIWEGRRSSVPILWENITRMG